MTWSAHKSGFNETPEQLMGRISAYYKAHPDAVGLSVLDVWRVLEGHVTSNASAKDQEEWKNTHWYLNGDWWSQSSEGQQFGFVEGYLWCMKTQVPASTESYSESPKVYRQKINAFVNAHPKQGKESIADTLRRFCDQTRVSPPR